MNDEHDEHEPTVSSFWDTLLREAVGSFSFVLEDEAGYAYPFEVDYPSAAAVAELDEVGHSDVDTLYVLLEEDDADRVLDLLDDLPITELQDLVDDVRAHFGILVPPPYGWAALVDDLERYGAAVERDLHDAGRDLYDWIRDHERLPWAKLYRVLLNDPPEGGHVEAARLADEDLALQQVKAEARGEVARRTSRPRLQGWTREREQNERIVELLEQVVHGVWGASPKFKGKGGAKPKGHPRPTTAYEKMRRYALYVEHDEIASQLLGSRYTPRVSRSLWDDGGDALDE